MIILSQSLQISSTDARAAVTQFGEFFSSTVRTPRLEIAFSNFTTLDGFANAVDQIQYIGGTTPTLLGLNISLSTMFQERNGMRRDFREFPKTLVLMTDGQSNSGGNLTAFRLLRQQFRDRNINVVGIGITQNVNENEILALVGGRHNYRPFNRFSDLYDPGLPIRLGLCDGIWLLYLIYTISNYFDKILSSCLK